MVASQGEVVHYKLPLNEQFVEMNDLIGRSLSIEYQGEINCIRCGRKTGKSFAQGFCYPCFTTAPETEECVLRPELCRAHEGQARDMAYAEQHCLSEQVVYVSYTSGMKVGVTRHPQVPTRWIDQGAICAIELARTPNRFSAGMLEVAMKEHVADKTNWRKMLSDVHCDGPDLVQEKQRLAALVPEDLLAYVSANDRITNLSYPVMEYPEKIKSLNLDKDPVVRGVLMGIKGQYLLFDQGRVINMRKYGGYLVRLQFSS